MNKRLKAGRFVFSAVLIIAFLNTVFLSWFGDTVKFKDWMDGIVRILPLMYELGAGIIGTSWIRSIIPKPLQVAKVSVSE